MTSYVNAELRRFVEDRAQLMCEYCRIAEEDTYLGCQIDHVISEKHGGQTEEANLALACAFCNRAKGTDIGSRAADGALTRLFNPRIDRWSEHFRLAGSRIDPCTPIGEATTFVLQFNHADRIIERDVLLRLGRYPPVRS